VQHEPDEGKPIPIYMMIHTHSNACEPTWMPQRPCSKVLSGRRSKGAVVAAGRAGGGRRGERTVKRHSGAEVLASSLVESERGTMQARRAEAL